MKSLSMLLVAVSMFAVSCERHEFDGPDGTKQLHTHGSHSTHDAAGDSHHAEEKAHSEKH